ncbi:MAG: DUF4105 domain-containing protein [Treponema sp.]|jgi:hypothetical protein|nr:DUF4105 domain-containing protein [Treponema sp.]
MFKKAVIFIVIFCVFSASAVFAADENLTVKIAVMGPGDELYFWWGHIALVIEDSFTGRSRFYDYGLFSFDNDHFFYNFAFGRLLYSCGASPFESNVANYVRTNRDVIIYTLDLPPYKRQEVRDFAEINILPENRDYYYHHFRDNCSTRIRDILDIAADGQFSARFKNTSGRFTFRGHVRRHTWFSPAADWFLNFLMGQDIDNPVTAWDEMFLPSEVGKNISDFYYTGADGVKRKLVSSVEERNFAIDRPVVKDYPYMKWQTHLVFSLALSLIFAAFFYLESRKIRAGRILAGISISLTGLFFGIASILAWFLTFFTNHDYTYHNMNIIFATPLLLASCPLGIIYAFAKNQNKKLLCAIFNRIVWGVSLSGIIVSMFLKLLPAFYQNNLIDQMLFLPLAVLFALQPFGPGEQIKMLKTRKSLKRGL